MTAPICRCCGRPLAFFDALCDVTSNHGVIETRDGQRISICTRCIPKHWGKHLYGRNASRCHEYGKRGRA